MTNQLIVGLGVVGSAIYGLYEEFAQDKTYALDTDPAKVQSQPEEKVDTVHICFPWQKDFLGKVRFYQTHFAATLTIIHSTVPIGTTKQLLNAVHSPVQGRHESMLLDLVNNLKWVGGPLAKKAVNELRKANMHCWTVDRSDTTEALKLMCLAKYGMSIAFAQYQKEICHLYGFKYEEVLYWDEDYNAMVDRSLKRPIIIPPGEVIGGSCVIPGVEMLFKQHPSPVLGEILRFRRKDDGD